ncbi:Dicer-like protein 1 [Blyttiomyces sp. JEL0837]|nr:Dicer-like protein 1 [Blyttiomyces sp. JEL0837]
MSAKRDAAFIAVKELYFNEELDDRLYPSRAREDLRELAPEHEKQEKLTKADEYDVKIPDIISKGWESHLGYLVVFKIESLDGSVERVLDLGMVLPASLPLEALDTFENQFGKQRCKVHSKMSYQALNFEELMPQVLSFQKVLLDALLRTITNQYVDFIYLFVPLKDKQLLWDGIEKFDSVDNFLDKAKLEESHNSKWASEAKLPTSRLSGINRVQPESDLSHDFKELFARHGQDLVVGDKAYYDRKYQVLDIITETNPLTTPATGFDSVAELYTQRLKITAQIEENQPVLVAKLLPHIYQSGRQQESSATVNLHLIPQFCRPFPIGVAVITESAAYLPLIVRSFHHRLLTLEIQDRLCLGDVTHRNLFQMAFIASSARSFANYQRLEFLGDAFLKMHLSLHIFSESPGKNEGWLTRTRSLMEKNTYLKVQGIAHNFQHAIMADALSRKSWWPPLYGKKTRPLSTKTIADTVESVIGAGAISKGVFGGAAAVRAIYGTSFQTDWANYVVGLRGKETSAGITMAYDGASIISKRSPQRVADKLEAMVGYRFQEPEWAMEALTHASALDMISSGSCYQRLEFLGDAVLGYVIARKLYDLNDSYTPAKLSEYRSELVNNQFLAVVAFQMGLTKMLQHSSSTLASALADFGEQLANVHRGSRDSKVERGMFWHQMPIAPKAAGDVFESLIGAVTVDSGGDIQVVEQIIDKVLFTKWWPIIVKSASGGRVSTEAIESNWLKDIFVAIAACKCKMITIKCEPKPNASEFVCKIAQHDTILAETEGSSKKAAKRQAAAQALPKIRIIMSGEQTCPCTVEAAKSAETVEAVNGTHVANGVEPVVKELVARSVELMDGVIPSTPEVINTSVQPEEVNTTPATLKELLAASVEVTEEGEIVPTIDENGELLADVDDATSYAGSEDEKEAVNDIASKRKRAVPDDFEDDDVNIKKVRTES